MGGGGLPAKYLLPFCCIGDILKFNMHWVTMACSEKLSDIIVLEK